MVPTELELISAGLPSIDVYKKNILAATHTHVKKLVLSLYWGRSCQKVSLVITQILKY